MAKEKNPKKDNEISNEKKKYDFTLWSIWIFLISFLMYIIALPFDRDIAFGLFLILPSLVIIGIFFLLIPISLLKTSIEKIIFYFYFKKQKLNVPKETIIILGNDKFDDGKSWINSSYGIELFYLIDYLKLKELNFSIYINLSNEDFKILMGNEKIKNIYLFGHGSRHTFSLNPKTVPIYYCEYENKKYLKNEVHQIHCNTFYGKSLIEYVVPQENHHLCIGGDVEINPIEIKSYFLNKILDLKMKTGFKRFFLKQYLNLKFYSIMILCFGIYAGIIFLLNKF